MDKVDRNILFELDCNSRASLSEIARRIHLGRDLVSYRIDRLKTQGIIKKCAAMVNPYKLGLTLYKTYLKLESNKERWNDFVSHLDRHPRTYWLAECYGKWDVVWCVLARTPKEVYDLQDRLFSEFRDVIVGYNVCTLVNYWWFPKKYLLDERRAGVEDRPGWRFQLPEFTFGATPAEHTFDDVEYGIVQMLSSDAQASVVDIAGRLNTTASVVKYRIEKLEELGVIPGYRVDIERSTLGMTLFKVQLSPRDFDAQREADFHNYCRIHPQISAYVQQLGDCKLEFEVEASNYEEFGKVMDEVREKFATYVRNMDYMMVKRDYLYRIPTNVFPAAEHLLVEDSEAGSSARMVSPTEPARLAC